MEKALKLYRGVSASEFNLVSEKLLRKNRDVWRLILSSRAKGNFKFPSDLSKEIIELHSNLRLEKQYFTDSKAIAQSYARKVGGLLIELSVPTSEILKHFSLEFQNFGLRKKNFEIVYCVPGKILNRHRERWKLKVKKL